MSLEEEFKHRNRLIKDQRKAVKKQAGQNYRDLKKFDQNRKSIKNPLSLVSYVGAWDMFFAIALTFAILKDILDFTGIGSLPLIGTVITILVMIVIAGAMLVAGSGMAWRRSARNTVLKRWGMLAAGTFVEFLFGLNFLPIETLTVGIVYYMTLAQLKFAKETEEQEENQKALAQLVAASAARNDLNEVRQMKEIEAADDYNH